jgi:hypothetical protein
MISKSFELATKALMGKTLTDDEQKYLHNYNAKYNMVRQVYMEEARAAGVPIAAFHFTPGDSFMETSAFAIVDELLRMNKAILTGRVRSVGWDEVDGPPRSGKDKTTL